MIFGNPPIMRAFIEMFHPGTDPSSLLLSPVGRAAWFGLFRHCVEPDSCVAARRRAHRLQPDGRQAPTHLHSGVFDSRRDGNSLLARLGLLGLRDARTFPSIQTSAGVRSLAASQRRAKTVGHRRSADLRGLLYALACDRCAVITAITERNPLRFKSNSSGPRLQSRPFPGCLSSRKNRVHHSMPARGLSVAAT